jgi:hypothetical protein
MENKRSAPRQRTFKGGSVSTPTGVMQCVIRNLSDTGALIELPGVIAEPDTFTLIIKPEELKRSCTVKWRIGRRLGVQFE